MGLLICFGIIMFADGCIDYIIWGLVFPYKIQVCEKSGDSSIRH